MAPDLVHVPPPTAATSVNPRCPRCERFGHIVHARSDIFAVCPHGCRSDVGKALYWRSDRQWVYLNARAKEDRDRTTLRVFRSIIRDMAEEPVA